LKTPRPFLQRLVWALSLCSSAALAYQNGISGRAEVGCSQCHLNSSTGARPTVVFSGPSAINAGASAKYSLTISGGPAVVGGFDVAVDGGSVTPLGTGEVLKDGEVTHDYPGLMDGGSLTYNFTVVAGTGGFLTLYATGLSANGDGTPANDKDMQAVVNVSINGGHAPPSVAQAPAAAASPVTGNSVALTVLGSDSTQAESGLTYTWTGSSSGGGSVSFSPNGDNAAKDCLATFTAAGTYSLTVTITNSVMQTATSTMTVDVVQTMTSLVTLPSAPTVASGTNQSFTAAGTDQFGAAMPASGILWSAVGDGTISSAGLFTAGAVAGSATVVATMGSLASSTPVTVTGSTETGTGTGTGAPTVSFSSPAMGANVSGELIVQVNASASAGVKWVTFSFDGSPFSVSTGPTYQAKYDTQLLMNGSHALTAVVTDHNGATASSAIEVTVSNPVPTMMSSAGGCSAGGGLAPWGAFLALLMTCWCLSHALARRPSRSRRRKVKSIRGGPGRPRPGRV
jgi:hypothetical protein